MAFMIVARDRPIYELDFGKREDTARLSQYILHASLDLVDLTVFSNAMWCVGSARRQRSCWKARHQ